MPAAPPRSGRRVASAPAVHQKRIEVRGRDVDNYGHVNNAVYLTYLEEVRDEWLARTLQDDEAGWDYVVARIEIDFRREVTQADDEVGASCRPRSPTAGWPGAAASSASAPRASARASRSAPRPGRSPPRRARSSSPATGR